MKVLVTGASGFVGQHVSLLLADKHQQLIPFSRVDLRKKDEVDRLMQSCQPDAVIHLAGRVGGIGANQASPAEFWRDNLLMGLNILDACAYYTVKRLVIAGTTCSYPRDARIPFTEDLLFTGYPEWTNAPYGIAKLALLEGARAYRRQWGLDSIFLVPTNLYGPGDHFDLENSHVIPAMIRKMHEAKRRNEPTVTLWGDGSATRDLLYVEDAAKAFVEALDIPPYDEPINLGASREVSMLVLAETIRQVVGYQGTIIWDTSRPNGQPRRCLDSMRALDKLKWRATTSLQEGLQRTYDWFKMR